MTSGFCISKPVPLTMRLFSYQGGVYVGNGQYILFGGVRDLAEKAQRSTYCYFTSTENATHYSKMVFDHYAMSTLFQFPWIYSCGGKQTLEATKPINRC